MEYEMVQLQMIEEVKQSIESGKKIYIDLETMARGNLYSWALLLLDYA